MSSSRTTAHPAGPSTVPDPTRGSTRLRTLYVIRFGFAVVWAVLIMIMATTISPATVALLVLYPLFDVVAAVVDFRSSGAAPAKVLLVINMALSLLTAIGLAVAVTSGIPSVLRVWGAWAITAGIVQLVVALLRYRLGGQWAMILSGGISTLAGASFIVMADGPNASLTTVAGYAILGGVFFLVSAIRLHRLATKTS